MENNIIRPGLDSVSIVIPALCNSEDCEGLLTAILLQSVQPSEVIVVRSGLALDAVSFWNNWIDRFKLLGSKCIVVRVNNTLFPGAARNLGLQHATKQWVAFLDVETIPCEHWLGEQMKRIEAANAMGKNVVKQHLFIFILGSAIVGIAGAMLVTQDGLFTPGSYQPMRYTFLIWVMVIVGGSGNNFGAILGGFVVWFLWIEAAPIALYLINLFTSGLTETHALKLHLLESVPYFRYLMMGMGLLLIMRYRKGIKQ